MLVLSRKREERIVFPTLGISVTVVEIRPDGKVRLGIEAPLEVPVHRSETWDKIRRNKGEAET